MAVKGFLSESDELQHCSVAELLEISTKDENLYHGYKSVMILCKHVYIHVSVSLHAKVNAY